jgi:hypothetical protein
MLRHHLSIVMLRIFTDVAHVWQLAIGTRFVEQYLTKTHPVPTQVADPRRISPSGASGVSIAWR